MRRIVLCSVFAALMGLALLGSALGREEAEKKEGATGLKALAWMAGRWLQEKDGDVLEETWAPPMADSLVGMFRWIRGGHCGLYEILAIEEDDGQIALRLRHFNRGLVPWASEAKGPLTYPLVRQKENEAVFENSESHQPRRFVYRREGDLLIVRLEGPDGKGMEFRFKRQG